MRIVFWVGFILRCSIGFAQDEALIASLQEHATANAKAYAEEVQQIAHANNTQQESLRDHLSKVGFVLVFLSFSMPEQSLEGWLRQCKQLGATPVIRGLVHNSFKETLQKMQYLSEKTKTGVQVDPILFQTFGITQVPAVVNVTTYDYCAKNMECRPISYNKIYGDVTLEYALQKMREG